jgi:hypothetical protein
MSGTFNYDGTIIQTDTIETTGTYDIVAFGAQGGSGGNAAGGDGAEIGGDFVLTAGTTIEIIVGAVGAGSDDGGGGGGGSFKDRRVCPLCSLS